MSGAFGSSQWMYNPSAGFYGTEIDNSLRFNDNDSAHLTRNFASDGTRTTWTFSCWLKRGNINTSQEVFVSGLITGVYYYTRLGISTSNKMSFIVYNDANQGWIYSANLLRDVGAWYHLVWVFDTTNATASDRMRMYINGERVTSFATETFGTTYPALNGVSSIMNSSYTHKIGRTENGQGSGNFLDGYLADVNFIDGQALDPTSFGETKSGIWIPKAYSGSYGTNGFHLEFAGNTNDSSGNSNNFTANNISAYDYVPDTPTNNFPTINATFPHANMTFSEGSLRHTTSTNNRGVVANILLPKSGKWYWEHWSKSFNYAPDNELHAVGINVPTVDIDASRGGRDTGVTLGSNNGQKNVEGTTSSYDSITGWAENQGCGVVFDADAGTIAWTVNGGSLGSAVSIPSGTDVDWIPFVGMGGGFSAEVGIFNFGQDGTFGGETTSGGYSDENGYGDFKWEPPSGALALCTANLPAPAIDPAADETPEDYFNTVLYTGDGTANRTISAGLTPDFVWMKDRSAAYSHILIDSVRGNGNYLTTNGTNQENWAGNLFPNSGSTTNGFVVDGNLNVSINANGDSYVAWNWKAGGTGVTNTDGSITSTVSANPDAGFSIVSYTGNATAGATVGHGLGDVPKMMILKKRNSAQGWPVYHVAYGATQYTTLNSTDPAQSASNNFNNTEPTSSVFTLGNGSTLNGSGDTFIAYCFADVEGYSKAGSYTGNGSTDGSFIYTGFRPAWVMTKNINVSSHHWTIYDNKRGTYNAIDPFIYANLSSAEGNTGDQIDFLSNGFKARKNDWNLNYGGVSYIYLAFAEQPFKYANAR